VVAGVDGPEENSFWDRVDDGTREGHAEIAKRAEKSFSEGEVIAMQPDHIHSVMNNSDAVTVSLHTYGMHVNHTGRSQYDAEKNLEIPFVVTEQ
jgi:predicted metal-dependent enzyme (double-stranded beta helix superfamily)